MPYTITSTNFNFHGQESVYNGKVRDVYFIGNKLVMIATDEFPHLITF